MQNHKVTKLKDIIDNFILKGGKLSYHHAQLAVARTSKNTIYIGGQKLDLGAGKSIFEPFYEKITNKDIARHLALMAHPEGLTEFLADIAGAFKEQKNLIKAKTSAETLEIANGVHKVNSFEEGAKVVEHNIDGTIDPDNDKIESAPVSPAASTEVYITIFNENHYECAAFQLNDKGNKLYGVKWQIKYIPPQGEQLGVIEYSEPELFVCVSERRVNYKENIVSVDGKAKVVVVDDENKNTSNEAGLKEDDIFKALIQYYKSNRPLNSTTSTTVLDDELQQRNIEIEANITSFRRSDPNDFISLNVTPKAFENAPEDDKVVLEKIKANDQYFNNLLENFNWILAKPKQKSLPLEDKVLNTQITQIVSIIKAKFDLNEYDRYEEYEEAIDNYLEMSGYDELWAKKEFLENNAEQYWLEENLKKLTIPDHYQSAATKQLIVEWFSDYFRNNFKDISKEVLLQKLGVFLSYQNAPYHKNLTDKYSFLAQILIRVMVELGISKVEIRHKLDENKITVEDNLEVYSLLLADDLKRINTQGNNHAHNVQQKTPLIDDWFTKKIKELEYLKFIAKSPEARKINLAKLNVEIKELQIKKDACDSQLKQASNWTDEQFEQWKKTKLKNLKTEITKIENDLLKIQKPQSSLRLVQSSNDMGQAKEDDTKKTQSSRKLARSCSGLVQGNNSTNEQFNQQRTQPLKKLAESCIDLGKATIKGEINVKLQETVNEAEIDFRQSISFKRSKYAYDLPRNIESYKSQCIEYGKLLEITKEQKIAEMQESLNAEKNRLETEIADKTQKMVICCPDNYLVNKDNPIGSAIEEINKIETVYKKFKEEKNINKFNFTNVFRPDVDEAHKAELNTRKLAYILILEQLIVILSNKPKDSIDKNMRQQVDGIFEAAKKSVIINTHVENYFFMHRLFTTASKSKIENLKENSTFASKPTTTNALGSFSNPASGFIAGK